MLAFETSSYLLPGYWHDGRKVEGLVVVVYLVDVGVAWRAKDLDDLDQLTHGVATGEEWLADEKLRQDTASRPNIWNATNPR